ncbi:hypothetical protein PPACK8108_LOCUS14398 [Phakopsora pachyrhizi]|uniref:CCHC-type domain-containing protein n=1 Tax=Phakopsora pachyrhizi TaxID=170000 RepID=A0AAV0B9T0_PHAPC|nr:hypothetical protein PPACK8108_LOCUS14398 [Phakopsora pachyrhizi]
MRGLLDYGLLYRGVRRFRRWRQRSTEVYGAFTEVYGVCRRFYRAFTEACRRFKGAPPEVFFLKRKEEEVKGASRTREASRKREGKEASRRGVWGSFWNFKEGGLCALRQYKSSRKERRYPGDTKESKATIRKVVKIPKEEESMFDGKGFHQFLDLFEMAAKNEGAEDYDKVKQVIFFYKGRDLKEEVMEMKGWRELDWGKLVKEMKARCGRYRPAPRYTIQELWTAVDGWEKKGGVSSKGDYEEFSHFFDTRLKYLEKEGTFRNEDKACPLLWRALSKELQEMAKFRLIKGKKMVENRSVDAEMKFKGEVSVEGSVYYRPFQGENEIMREELNKKRERYRGKDREESKKEEENKKRSQRHFIGQTVERNARLEESLKKAGKRREVYKARDSGSFVCYYCGMQGHAPPTCPRVEEDLKNGLVRRDMTAEGKPAYYLPDNTRVHYDRTMTFRSVVAAYSSKVPLEKFTTQVAELPGIIHLPEPLPANEDSFVVL